MEQRKSMRRGCTRIGLALLANFGATYLCVWGLEMLIYLVYPEALSNMTFLMLVSDLGTYGAGGLVLWLLLRPLPQTAPNRRSMTPVRFGKLTLEAIGLMYSASLLTTMIVSLITAVTGQDMSNLLDSTVESMPLASMFFYMVIVAPICEEVIFRRILFRRLLPMGQKFAVVISALAFGLYHSNLYQFFYATALGLLFGCVVAKTGRIRYTILLHAILNLLGSVVVTWLEPFAALSVAFTILIYALMIAGLIVLVRDFRSLVPAAPSLPGCWRAAFTAPGWLAYVVVLGVTSVAVTFFV